RCYRDWSSDVCSSDLTPDRLRPVRLVAQSTSYTDHAGAVWSPDNYFSGGQFSTHGVVVGGTEDPDLYAGERYGNFTYAIPADARSEERRVGKGDKTRE